MKVSQRTHKVAPRLFLVLVSLYAVFIVGLSGCGDDDNDWVGTWSLETVDGMSFEQSFSEEGIKVSVVTNSWTFNSDGTIEAELAFKVEAKEGGSEITATTSTKVMGTYSLSGTNYTVTMEEGEEEGILPVEQVDTGTWSRKGSTLTLNSDDGDAVVFKKK